MPSSLTSVAAIRGEQRGERVHHAGRPGIDQPEALLRDASPSLLGQLWQRRSLNSSQVFGGPAMPAASNSACCSSARRRRSRWACRRACRRRSPPSRRPPASWPSRRSTPPRAPARRACPAPVPAATGRRCRRSSAPSVPPPCERIVVSRSPKGTALDVDRDVGIRLAVRRGRGLEQGDGLGWPVGEEGDAHVLATGDRGGGGRQTWCQHRGAGGEEGSGCDEHRATAYGHVSPEVDPVGR